MMLAALSAAAYYGMSTLLYSAVADTLPARGVCIAAASGALVLNMSGMISPLIFGRMIDSGGYQPAFLMVAACASVALLAVGLLSWLVPQESVG